MKANSYNCSISNAGILDDKLRPELVVGVIGALGTDMGRVRDAIAVALAPVKYRTEDIDLGAAVSEVGGLGTPAGGGTEHDRISSRMERGNELERAAGPGAAASLAVAMMQRSRERVAGSAEKPAAGRACVLGPITRPSEIKVLRGAYGGRLLLVSAYSPRDARIKELEKTVGDRAGLLVDRDYHEEGGAGQSVRDAFQVADFFLVVSDLKSVRRHTGRFFELVFGNTFHTPTLEESGMFHAFAAARLSSSMSRQVGVAVQDARGNLLATGVNEVPKAGGGVYAAGDEPDWREFRRGYDSNRRERDAMLADALSRLGRAGLLSAECGGMSGEEIAAMVRQTADLSGMKIMGVTEYGREAHAEMDALAGAARRGVPVCGCIMYCTTFPCHVCAKLIVDAGIRLLVFVETYEKSHAGKLFADSISVESPQEGKVHFKPFMGIAPKRYIDLFTMGRRKDASGRKAEWNAAEAVPRLLPYGEYLKNEDAVVKRLHKAMAENGLSPNYAE